MSAATGNPHFDDAAKNCAQLVTEDTANEHYLSEQGITDETMQFSALNRVAESNLAIAYEQRTANLIALADHVRSDATKTALIDVACERMGLIQPDRKAKS